MSKKPNTKLIGAFILGGTALMLVGVVLFGSGKLFSEVSTYVLYFEGNVAGLDVGAPVAFRGVKVGEVSRVLLEMDMDEMNLRIPVLIDVDFSRIQTIEGEGSGISEDELILALINKGLRARLKMQSVVTGQLYVEFNFHPDTPVRLVKAETGNADLDMPELPTIPSEIEKLQKTIENLPIESLIARALGALEGIERLVNSPETVGAIENFSRTLKNVEILAADINRRLPELASGMKATVDDTRGLVKNIDGQVTVLGEDLNQIVGETLKLVQAANTLVVRIDKRFGPLSASAGSALNQARDTLQSFETMTSKDSPMGHKLYTTLDELSAAARSIRIFAEYLERHPEALIQGKGR